MLSQINSNFKVKQVEKSRISEVNYETLSFGKEFTDHMFVVKYENGKWQQGEILPYGNLSLSPACSALHYGQSIFEGMKAHRLVEGGLALFRPYQNIARFNHSAKRMSMPEIPADLFMEGLKQLIALDGNWAPNRDGCSLYIRPMLFGNDSFIGVRTSESYVFVIILCPVGAYYAEPVSVIAIENYSRAEKGGVGHAKTAGNYAKTLMPVELAKSQGFKDVMWLGGENHNIIQEIGTMNVFFVVDGKLITPEKDGTFLEGITRESVIQIAQDLGYEVTERQITIDEIIAFGKQNRLQEAFGTGTAATVHHISKIAYKNDIIDLNPEKHLIANHLKKTLESIKTGQYPDKHNWLVKI
jgi:branched-chain amino acid aminotransferase